MKLQNAKGTRDFPPEEKIKSGGYRILSKLSLSKKEIDKLVVSFGNLGNLIVAEDNEIKKVLKDNTETFKKELTSLKENIVMAKKI